MELLSAKFRQGDVLVVRYPFVKHVDIVPKMYRRLIDSTVYQLPEIRGTLGRGKHYQWYYMTEIPRTIPPGIYRYEIIFEFELNFLRTVTYKLQSDEFEILPLEGEKK